MSSILVFLHLTSSFPKKPDALRTPRIPIIPVMISSFLCLCTGTLALSEVSDELSYELVNELVNELADKVRFEKLLLDAIDESESS